MSGTSRRMLKAGGFTMALGLAMVRLGTWASRVDVRCNLRGATLAVTAEMGGASVDFDARLPGQAVASATEGLRAASRRAPHARFARHAVGSETLPW